LSDDAFAKVFPAGPVRRHARIACSVRNGFMFSPFGVIVLPDGSIVRESLLHTDASAMSFTYAQFTGQFPGRHVLWTAAEAPLLSLNTYSTNNYFHFLIDALAQLHWRDVIPAMRYAPMIVSGYHPDAAKALPFVAAAQSLAGLAAGELVPFDGTIMLCRHVVFPARDTGANPTKIAELRRRFGLGDKRTGTSRLYITRPNAGRRRLVNDAEIAARLTKRGFVALDPGAWSFQEQVAAFGDAAVIVGPHGAALTNAAFMPPGGALVELTHTARVVWTYHEVAAAAGLSFACVVGSRVSETDNALFADFRVDPDAVDAAVDAALEAVRQ
jgi:capsular polysaccharide biosynthesis protein